MNATDFKVGDQVRYSAKAFEWGVANEKKRTHVGTVRGYSRRKFYVGVHWNHSTSKKNHMFSPDFLEKVETEGKVI